MLPQIRRFFLILMLLSITEPVKNQSALSLPAGMNEFLNKDRLDRNKLETAILYYTNVARNRYRLSSCSHYMPLKEVARKHSDEMAQLRYFSHHSPIKGNQSLEKRYKNSGIKLENVIIGENLAVDYFLAISEVPYIRRIENGRLVYYDAESKRPIPSQTYRQFAEKTVENWLHSEGHRENLLRASFTQIGIGVTKGRYKGLDAIYVTQNFMGPVAIRSHHTP